jgi:ATP synthase F1 subcomplex delta subunit
LAEQQGALDQVANDLKSLRAMIKDSADLRRLIGSPIMSREEQQKGIGAVAAKAGLADLSGRFLGLVAANRRLFALPGMIEAYLKRLADRRGEVTANVTAAQPLTDQQLAALEASLKTAVGSNVAIQVDVDPELLGGLVVQVGSRMVDNSLRTKLQQLKLVMKGVG